MINKAREFAMHQIESTKSLSNRAIDNLDSFATHNETIQTLEKRSMSLLDNLTLKIDAGVKTTTEFINGLTGSSMLN
jgi:hypothetical protein